MGWWSTAAQMMSIAISIASHIAALMHGKTQYDIIHMFAVMMLLWCNSHRSVLRCVVL